MKIKINRLIMLGLASFAVLISSCDKDDKSLYGNAEIIDFNSDKSACCWGWTIKINNDTIRSIDEIIGETVGYQINDLIEVYIELGEMEQSCSEQGFTNPNQLRDYYKIIKIELVNDR